METSSLIWPNFKIIQALTSVIVTSKYEIDPIMNSREKVALYVYGDFFRRSRAANSAVSCRIWQKFELLQALMDAIITCKYEKDRIKNSRKKWQHPFFHYNPVCCHGNQWSDLAKFQIHLNSHVCDRYLQV